MDYWSDANMNTISARFEYRILDYRDRYKQKRKALHDMVEDNDGFTREEIYDLVLTANKAVYQRSKSNNE
jgi:hypothetical protein